MHSAGQAALEGIKGPAGRRHKSTAVPSVSPASYPPPAMQPGRVTRGAWSYNRSRCDFTLSRELCSKPVQVCQAQVGWAGARSPSCLWTSDGRTIAGNLIGLGNLTAPVMKEGQNRFVAGAAQIHSGRPLLLQPRVHLLNTCSRPGLGDGQRAMPLVRHPLESMTRPWPESSQAEAATWKAHLKREARGHREAGSVHSLTANRPTLQQMLGGAFKITQVRRPLVVPWVFHRNNRGGSLGVQGGGRWTRPERLLFLGSMLFRHIDHHR